MNVVWTEPAVRQLEAIYAFIAVTSEASAQRWASTVVSRADALGDFPLMGRIIPERQDPNLREIIVRPYRVMYAVLPSRVDVIAVVHGARGSVDDVLPNAE